MVKISAIIVAGGSSARMGGIDKLFLKIGAKTVLERSIEVFCDHPLISQIVVVTSKANIERVAELKQNHIKISAVVEGGATRALSVKNGIDSCDKDTQYYAIHDGARPFASASLITKVINCAIAFGAAAPGTRVVDTIKLVDDKDTIISTPNREQLVAIATPQVFEAVLYRNAIKGVQDAFDDCQMLERIGRKAQVVEGESTNIKITEQSDIARARQIAGEAEMRIGHGYDVHKLVDGRKLIIGGVDIPNETGLLGHSDADVLAHAIMDSILGAAGLGDIGLHFPDTSARFKNIDSLLLLKKVVKKISDCGYAVGNIDATILCQEPKLRPHIDRMCENLALCCGIDQSKINVKATTEEGLGFTGSKSGIAAHAVTLLIEK